jgi:CheY-like chemotaxis protein
MSQELNILVADDSQDDIFLLQQAFKKAKVPSRFCQVCDGQEACNYLQGEGCWGDRLAHPLPDVLLLDLDMPHKNGFEVLEWVREQSECSLLIVYVLSASARDSDIQRAHDLKANGYVVKPIQVADLVRFVQTLHQWHEFVVIPPHLTPTLASKQRQRR